MVARRLTICLGLLAVSLPPVAAQALDDGSDQTTAERAILVLDASGSMWGQIDGDPKIAIAREVIDGLLQNWDPNVELGVTAYGHREKGNCADIETLVPVGPTDRDEIMSAVDSLNPKGKTPLTDAVRQAANTLRYTEERATVILVSDGKETCDVDPCAAAKELEASGVDFTVHVVGFDLDADEKAQLQCLAETTDGRFLSASTASELHEAMATTVELVAEPAPKPKRVVKVASTGKVTVINTTDKFFVRPAEHVGGGFVTQISDGETVQLKVGSYRLDTSNQERLAEFDVVPGETLTIDMNAFVGWASVTNTTDKFFVRPADHIGGGFVTQISDGETVQLQAGSYRLDTSNQERLAEFDVVPGETRAIDMNAFVGWASVINTTDKFFVRPADHIGGGFVTQISDGETVQLQAGSYRLDTSNQERLAEFDVVPGETRAIDMNAFVGWASVINTTDKFFVRPADHIGGGFVTQISNGETVQLQAGSYRLDTSKQEGLAEFDVVPGEEIVIDIGG